MGQPIQSMNALAGTVISNADHAILGQQLGAAGFDGTEISSLLSMIERKTMEVMTPASKEVAMSVVAVMVELVANTHRAAAMEIHRRLANQTGGLGGVSVHRKCANIAWDVANAIPRHMPVAATPIIGSIR